MTTQAPYPSLRTAEFEVVAETHDAAIAKAWEILNRFDPDGTWVLRAHFTPNTTAYDDEGPKLWSAAIEAARRMP